ncbi:hypothetical protein ONZ45_g6658 [Pleurotus djamor]|nr:hypothetical protein ONZ45_g6658 [Pleurotus djamor]
MSSCPVDTTEVAPNNIDPSTFIAPSLPFANITIEFCDRCRWLHRAAWVQTELFLTFPPPVVKAITIIPLNSEDTAGRFRVWVSLAPDANPILVWDRKFEGGFPELKILIHDSDAIISTLKACLKTSNNHLTSAAIAVLPPLFPLLLTRSVNHHGGPIPPTSSSTSSTPPSSIIDVPLLRYVLTTFLPTGGILDRLGDKERVQNSAREALVILGGLSFRCGSPSTMSSRSVNGKGTETPLMIFERYLRDGGLKSKVWKVREQSILTLVQIRRAHHLYPIRPYLSALVDALEDTDAHVRDCARQSVVELFTGPGVTDAARADLKKEMTKKGVRKTIVDSVVAKVVGGSAGSNPQSDASDCGEPVAKVKEYVPPSIALMNRRPTAGSSSSAKEAISRPASRSAMNHSPTVASTPTTPAADGTEVEAIYIASTRDLENEFASMQQPFDGKETEHNWAQRERSIQRVRGMLRGGAHTRYFESFLNCLKEGFIQWSLKALASLRTTVSTNTCSLYAELATSLETALDPFCDTLLTNLLKMANLTKKLAAQQSQSTVATIITHTSAQPRLVLSLLWQTLQEKNAQARGFSVDHFKTYLQVHGQRGKSAIENSGGVETLEKAMKKGLSDPNPAVKEKSRVCFWQFYEVWSDRGTAIMDKLDATAKKQLEKVCPTPGSIQLSTTPAPAAKKSSVAAAIAASRAKARAIATAPPTLRHQATSAAQNTPTRRPGSPSTSPRSSLSARPSSPLRISTPASPPRSRVVSNGISRSITTASIPTTHSRQSSSTSGRVSPPSPVSDPASSFRRRNSSPLATSPSPGRNSVIRKAVQVPLPASPPTGPRGARPVVLVKPLPRQSTTLFDSKDPDDSLILATNIPIPEDDGMDDDADNSINLMSFSAPFELYPPVSMPTPPSEVRDTPSFSPKSNDSQLLFGISNTLSSGSVEGSHGGVIVEEAIRARAEQAESAAERLLELVEPEEEGLMGPTIPESLLVGSSGLGLGHSTPKPKSSVKPAPIPIFKAAPVPPVTPVSNRNLAIMKQAALFTDSPVQNGKSGSLMDVLQDRKQESGWWLKRMNLMRQDSSVKEDLGVPSKLIEIQECISALEAGICDVPRLKRLALLCRRNPVADAPLSPFEFGSPTSPSPFLTPANSIPSLQIEIWDKDKNFERLFNALMAYLEPEKNEEAIEYGLIILWEMMENQASYLEGREADMFSLLLRIRFCQQNNVLSATNTIRDALTTRIEPVYGLTTMHASMRAFLAEPHPPSSSAEVKSSTYAFGLIALGKFILRLPAEIAEEELPRLKDSLITALNDKSSLVVRESAAATIIATQLVLRDETHLFMLLDGLADEKKNLLTYLFDKHGVRGLPPASSAVSIGPSGVDKLEKEMRRLDTRMNTPPRTHE